MANVSRILTNICNMKFSGADRTPLHNLGISDQDIDRADTCQLAVDMMTRAKGR